MGEVAGRAGRGRSGPGVDRGISGDIGGFRGDSGGGAGLIFPGGTSSPWEGDGRGYAGVTASPRRALMSALDHSRAMVRSRVSSIENHVSPNLFTHEYSGEDYPTSDQLKQCLSDQGALVHSLGAVIG